MGKNFYYLTKREIEILQMIADGKKNHQIAEILFISRRTVDTHKTHLCIKLNLKTTVELTCFATSKKEELNKFISS